MEIHAPRVGEVSLEVLLGYSEYMRERFSMALLEMPASDYLAPLGLSWMFTNIRDLFLHVVDCEDHWVRGIIQGGGRVTWNPEDFPDAASLVTRWEEVRARTRAALAAADAAELGREIVTEYQGSPRFTVRQIYTHLLIHEVHHRGQITAAMRMRGISPPPSDLYDYIAEQLQ